MTRLNLTESLGNYEKQAILELDNSLSWLEAESIKHNDPCFRLMQSIISNSWEQNQPVKLCIEKIHAVFEPALYGGCVPISATD